MDDEEIESEDSISEIDSVEKSGFGKFEYILVGIIAILIIFIAFIIISGALWLLH